VGLLVEPLDRRTSYALRRAVLDFRTSERRRVFGPLLRVGVPGGHALVVAAETGDATDQALRADVVGAMLRRTATDTPPAPLVWLTRAGSFTLHDADAAWLAAAAAAYAEAGAPLTMVVVTRQGWWDPRSGLSRVWKRLRQR
jgi:hypothetical protein